MGIISRANFLKFDHLFLVIYVITYFIFTFSQPNCHFVRFIDLFEKFTTEKMHPKRN